MGLLPELPIAELPICELPIAELPIAGISEGVPPIRRDLGAICHPVVDSNFDQKARTALPDSSGTDFESVSVGLLAGPR
ncbi:hypothetical protein [Rubripirellula obstinata]|uniref:hypothetical protein n=1 Tax=Rubripirellula obstinata TaxID=406547 RepID=UPI00082F72B9|nr:hypothetical protein [Rubripirellula obstinata]